MMSKSLSMMAVLFSLGNAAAVCHDAMSPAAHALQSTTLIAAHQAAAQLLEAREAHIVENNEFRKTVENARHADELARLVADKAALAAAHARAAVTIAADRAGIHGRMAAAPLFAALPSADPAIPVGGAGHPAAPAALAGLPATLLARNTDDARHEAEHHTEQLNQLDRARDSAIAAHNDLLTQFDHDVRTHLEETRRAEEARDAAHHAALTNLGQRLQRHIREERENAAAAAVAAANAAEAAVTAARGARRNAAILAAGGRV